MNLSLRQGRVEDAQIIAEMVCALTTEICTRADINRLDNDVEATVQSCKKLLSTGDVSSMLAFDGESCVGMLNFSTSHALYLRGEIGIVQELYVVPSYRSQQVGKLLLARIEEHGAEKGWAAIELCTPPLPAFEKSLQFYSKNSYDTVGGRKMRKRLV